MGKDLKGKELGLGISQRQDGMYTGRFTTKSGKRKQKYFHKLQECRAWIAEARFQDEHGNPLFSDSPTVDAWFEYWLNEVKGDSIRETTRNCYKKNWRSRISPIIGDMELQDVKPIHCQKILNDMMKTHKNKTIKSRRFLLWTVFECALENNFIEKNPVTNNVKASGGQQSKERMALTIEEQKEFLKEAKNYCYYNEYALVLQTGLRVGELTALKWSDVDFTNKKLHISRSAATMPQKGFIIGDTKTYSGIRDIPLTDEAIRILKDQKAKSKDEKVISMKYADYIFTNRRGNLIRTSAYYRGISVVCNHAGLRQISMHILRHTFATRCIENGMRPKTLQSILGHSKIEMTMNLYVHVTEDSKIEEMELIEDRLKMV